MTKYTPAQLGAAKRRAKKYFQDKKGIVSVKVLSRVAGVPQGTIREWMAKKDWPQVEQELELKSMDILEGLARELELTEQEELFCYHFLISRNTTTAALKAGWSPSYAHNKAYRLLKREGIQKFLTQLRIQRNEELFYDAVDLLQTYIKIANTNMSDYVSFGPEGVTLRPSEKVDGQMIAEIKEGRDGISIKLVDKHKALEVLAKYLGVTTDGVNVLGNLGIQFVDDIS